MTTSTKATQKQFEVQGKISAMFDLTMKSDNLETLLESLPIEQDIECLQLVLKDGRVIELTSDIFIHTQTINQI